MNLIDEIKIRYNNTMDEVRRNIAYGRIAVQRRSVLSEIGMLHLKKGQRSTADPEIEDIIKLVTALSREIKEVARELHIQEAVDFTEVKSGKDPIRDTFNEFMLRISTSSEKYSLRTKYDSLVEKGIDALSQLGYFSLNKKDRELESNHQFIALKERYEKIDEDYSRMGKELKELQTMARDRSEFLIPILTFLLSFNDYSKKKHYPGMQ